MNSSAYDSNPNSFDFPPDSHHPPHPTYETYSGDSCGNDSQSGYDCPPQFPLNYEPEPGYTQNYNSCPHDSPSFLQQYPCCDDCGVTHEPYQFTPCEPIDSLSVGDEHLDTIPTKESNEFIKSCVENLVPNPSESEGENGCDVPSCFTTFSNIIFDDEYEFDSVDDQSLHNHHFNAEFDLVESMLNRNSLIISSSSKIDSLLDEFAGELTLLKSIPPGIDKPDCHPENEIRLSQRLLYDNSSPRPLDSFMKEINLFLIPNDPMPPSIEDDEDSKGDILFLERLLHDDPIPLPDTLDFSYEVRIFLPFFTYPVTSPVLLSSGSEDKIFDPGITVYRFYSF
nr:hypothetical protein [Tanacetum cinerariifolium]